MREENYKELLNPKNKFRQSVVIKKKQLNEKRIISLSMAGCTVVCQGPGLVCSQGLQCL